MQPNLPNDSVRLRKYLSKSPEVEGKTIIPKKDEKDPKKYVNDDFNEYDISDDPNEDDRDW